MAKEDGPSAAFRERLAAVLFDELPSVDGDELSRVYGLVVNLVRKESRRVAMRAWDGCCELAKEGAERAAARARHETFAALIGQASNN